MVWRNKFVWVASFARLFEGFLWSRGISQHNSGVGNGQQWERVFCLDRPLNPKP